MRGRPQFLLILESNRLTVFVSLFCSLPCVAHDQTKLFVGLDVMSSQKDSTVLLLGEIYARSIVREFSRDTEED